MKLKYRRIVNEYTSLHVVNAGIYSKLSNRYLSWSPCPDTLTSRYSVSDISEISYLRPYTNEGIPKEPP